MKPITRIFSLSLLFFVILPGPVSAAQSRPEGPAELIATKVATAPVIDGNANDPMWSQAKPLVTYDPLAKIKLTIRSVYTKDSVFLIASFPDKTENRRHKTQIWVPAQSRYRLGKDREDTLVIKWLLDAPAVNFRVDAEEPYKADIWYWKSHRTDHAGYADDKMHIYSSQRTPNSKTVISKNGNRFFLSRPGDSGRAAYKTIIHGSNVGDRTSLYRQVAPQGSRADVRAKGVWRKGIWTVEFSRKLLTGNPDDIQFHTQQAYRLGVSRYEIAGRKINPTLEEPYFGAGEITEILSLRFK